MKRILVIDESVAVRETLALILGREFVVAHRSPTAALADSDEQVDLLILGVAPGSSAETASLVKTVPEAPFAILFLVDSMSAVLVKREEKVDYLAKPFNPFELRDKVGRLLARRSTLSQVSKTKSYGYSRFLEYPYLSRSASLMARRFALTDLPVLIYGEVGCGQDRVARAIYEVGGHAEPLIPIYAGELPESLPDESPFHQSPTLLIEGLDDLGPLDQARLLNFLEGQQSRGRRIRVLSKARQDLLEKVYRGEFLDSLYYLLASLKLRLPPLRERTDELPALAQRVAQECGARLGLNQVSFSPGAIERLRNYLWFGNLGELEAVMSRTLAVHRKTTIEADDLMLEIGGAAEDAGAADEIAGGSESEGRTPSGAAERRRFFSFWGNGNGPNLIALINELAHELKNPMVTIKTFAQLLGERFDDAAFRSRFQETVSNDIDRMDDLLEALLDFSRFESPQIKRVPIVEELRRVVEEILPDCTRRRVTLRLAHTRETVVFADATQVQYVVKNVLRAALGEVRSLGEITMDVADSGEVSVSYIDEGRQALSLRRYLEGQASSDEEVLPVRVLLAKILLQRNGGLLRVERREGGEVRAILQFPTGESGVQCP